MNIQQNNFILIVVVALSSLIFQHLTQHLVHQTFINY